MQQTFGAVVVEIRNDINHRDTPFAEQREGHEWTGRRHLGVWEGSQGWFNV